MSTTPIAAPVVQAVRTPLNPNLAAAVQADLAALALGKPMYVPAAADFKGSDPDALTRFQMTLPTYKRKARIVDDKEEVFVDANGNVIDEPLWQVAQAETGGAAAGTAEAGTAAGSAASGSAASGSAAGSAASGSAAGYAAGAPVMSPFAAVAGLPLVGGGSGGAPDVAPLVFKLRLDAPETDAACGPEWTGRNANSAATRYYFQDNNGTRILPVEDSGYSVSGIFKINIQTGEISLTEEGAAMSQYYGTEDFDHLCATYALKVVVVNDLLGSDVVSVVMERVFSSVEKLMQGDAYHVLDDSDEHDSMVVMVAEERESDSLVDLLDLQPFQETLSETLSEGVSKRLPESLKFEDLHFSVGDEYSSNSDLIMSFGLNDEEYTVAFTDQFGGDVTGIEFIHFAQGSTYHGYKLNDGSLPVDEGCDGQFFYDGNNGIYHLMTSWNYEVIAETPAIYQVDGTVCNDVLAGNFDDVEVINGMNGNDLLFASGNGDTLDGGSGRDLLVLDEDACHGVVVLGSEGTEGEIDTVVHFFHDDAHNAVSLTGFSFDLHVHNDIGCEEDCDLDLSDDFVQISDLTSGTLPVSLINSILEIDVADYDMQALRAEARAESDGAFFVIQYYTTNDSASLAKWTVSDGALTEQTLGVFAEAQFGAFSAEHFKVPAAVLSV